MKFQHFLFSLIAGYDEFAIQKGYNKYKQPYNAGKLILRKIRKQILLQLRNEEIQL